MTMPVERLSPSMVMLFRVKSRARMMVKVAMMEVGMETAAMMAERRFRMNRNTTAAARKPPRIMWVWTSSNDRRMKRD